MTSVRVRGVYTTALTRLFLDSGLDVVQASAPIRRRFDADLPPADHDLAVETSDDRQGVGLAGDAEAVERAGDLLSDLAVDVFSWADPTPVGAVYDGRVTDTHNSGAVVDLGDREGFLPFAATDGYVDEGDELRVQVRESAAPWTTDRPELATDLRAGTGLATLTLGGEGIRVQGEDGPAGRELSGITELLDSEVPEGWGLRWRRDAVDADMPALEAALSRAGEQAEALDAALARADDVEPVREVAVPAAGAWIWFGREARFALDDVRRNVTPTMPGHHRTKAASRSASAGVDFAEALCGDDLGTAKEAFPFAVVTDQFGPAEGDRIRIDHGKPDGRRIVLGKGEVLEKGGDGSLTLERQMSGGGTYDALGTEREHGDTARTSFKEGRWWYPTTYRSESGEVKGTYVNICTPVEVFPDAVRYVDLEVDVIKHPDGTVERVDDDELTEGVETGDIPPDLAERAREVAGTIERAL